MFDAMMQAVIDAGGEPAPIAEASALMWADPAAAADFPGAVANAPELEWIQLPYAGIENFASQLDPSKIWTCGKGVYADPVAEHIITLTLAGFRHLHTSIPATSWPPQLGRNLLGANVTVIGADVARGGLVVTDDLVDALSGGLIAGAALDVTEPEPLPDGHALWHQSNCIVTPHVGNTPEMGLPLIAERVRQNVQRWIAGEELIGLVDVEAGY